MDPRCACSHRMGGHRKAWPRPASCTVLIRSPDGDWRPCPCPDYQPRTRAGSRRAGRRRRSLTARALLAAARQIRRHW